MWNWNSIDSRTLSESTATEPGLILRTTSQDNATRVQGSQDLPEATEYDPTLAPSAHSPATMRALKWARSLTRKRRRLSWGSSIGERKQARASCAAVNGKEEELADPSSSQRQEEYATMMNDEPNGDTFTLSSGTTYWRETTESDADDSQASQSDIRTWFLNSRTPPTRHDMIIGSECSYVGGPVDGWSERPCRAAPSQSPTGASPSVSGTIETGRRSPDTYHSMRYVWGLNEQRSPSSGRSSSPAMHSQEERLPDPDDEVDIDPHHRTPVSGELVHRVPSDLPQCRVSTEPGSNSLVLSRNVRPRSTSSRLDMILWCCVAGPNAIKLPSAAPPV